MIMGEQSVKMEMNNENSVELIANDSLQNNWPQSVSMADRIEQDIDESRNRGVKTFRCVLCSREFTRKDKIKRHLTESHYGIKNFECPICRKKFARNEKVSRHINEVHNASKEFHCTLCDRKFRRDWQFRHHVKTAHPDKQGLFSSGSVITFDSLKSNSASIPVNPTVEQLNIEPVNGNDLDKSSPGLYFQLEVDNKESQSKDGTLYECTLCGKPFKQPEKLRRHYQETHSGIKEHECPICGKRFCRKERLLRHVSVIHQKVKAFVCPHCNREYSNEYSYQQHLQNVHNYTMNTEPVICVAQPEF